MRSEQTSFSNLPGLKTIDVFDFGATPLSSIRAPVDLMISGPETAVLDRIGKDVEHALARALARTRPRSRAAGPWTTGKSHSPPTRRNWRCTGFRQPRWRPSYPAPYAASPARSSGSQRGRLGCVAAIPRRAAAEHRPDGRLRHPRLPAAMVPLGQLGKVGEHWTSSVITRQGLQQHPGYPGVPRKASHQSHAGGCGGGA